jgi:O-antigen/teichoic acid export membrane protein
MFEPLRARVRAALTAQGLRDLAGDLAVLLNTQVAGTALSFAVSLVLARMLGPGGLGVYAFATAILMILQPIAGGGLGTLANRELARRGPSGADGEALAGRLIGLSLYWSLTVAALLAVGAAVVDPGGSRALYLAVLVLPTAVVMETMGGVLSGQHRVRQSQAFTNPGKFGIFLILLGGVWAIGGGTADAEVALIALAAASAVVIALLYRASPVKPGLGRVVVPGRRGLLGLLRMSLPFAALAALHYLQRRIDIVMLGALMDDASVGQYQVAGRVADICALPAALVGALLAPRFAARVEARDRSDLRQLFWRGNFLAVGAGVGLFAVMVPLAPLLVRVAFGADYLPAVPALYVLAVGAVAMSVKSVSGMLMVMSGQERKVALVLVTSAVVNCVGNWLLIPVYGLVGAAASTAAVAAMTALGIVALVYRSRILGTPPGRG